MLDFIKRTGPFIQPDLSRVLIRPFNPVNGQREVRIIGRILSHSEEHVAELLAGVMAEFKDRHQNIGRVFLERFEQVRHFMITDHELSENRKKLIGSYFTHEYSLEAAALFNPSIVPHPDQTGVAPGSVRIVLSLRATGDGHISSLCFRSGIVDSENRVALDPVSRHVTPPRPMPSTAYEKALFERKLFELGLENDFSRQVLGPLREFFTMAELNREVDAMRKRSRRSAESEFTARGIMLLAQSNYEVKFEPDQPLCERAIFPMSPSQINGIEDARFVDFRDDDGSRAYYATYSAYDGRIVLPQLLETTDFLRFKFITLNGPAVQNKGMALFPRKINGLYAMLSRQDNENLLLMYSDNIHFWYEAETIVKPTFPWEYVQIGNCGSPVETESGWLVLTHGVGPMRKYCIGALLLDLEDPRRIIKRLQQPLIAPSEEEREGYVPNVVYTCGCLLRGNDLIIPYAVSDYATTFASAPLDALLAAMK